MDDVPKPPYKKLKQESLNHPLKDSNVLVSTYTLTREQLTALGVSEVAINNLPSSNSTLTQPRSAIEKDPNKVRLNDLPLLPFEVILSYLGLEDWIRSRAVSRRWCKTIDSFRPKSLSLAKRPIEFLAGKKRWVSDAFVQNFISSLKFVSFFCTYNQSILSKLKQLCLCDLSLTSKEREAFVEALNSLNQLEDLGLYDCGYSPISGPNKKQETKALELKLNLPMLRGIQIECLDEIGKLILDAPKLQRVKLLKSDHYLRVDIVHAESVERLAVDQMAQVEVKKLKNLKSLYIFSYREIHSTLLFSLEQLEEIHLNDPRAAREFFEQKKRYGRQLKIYLCGLLLEDPVNDKEDPALKLPFGKFNAKIFACLAENASRLADEIPFFDGLPYTAIESVHAGLEMPVLARFSELNHILVDKPVTNIERFLNFLKNCDRITELSFNKFDPSQTLLNRLPDHCALLSLAINGKVSEPQFLFKFTKLIYLEMNCPIDAELIQKVLKELPFLLTFKFKFDCGNRASTMTTTAVAQAAVTSSKRTKRQTSAATASVHQKAQSATSTVKKVTISIEPKKGLSVWIGGDRKGGVMDLNASIELITGTSSAAEQKSS